MTNICRNLYRSSVKRGGNATLCTWSIIILEQPRTAWCPVDSRGCRSGVVTGDRYLDCLVSGGGRSRQVANAPRLCGAGERLHVIIEDLYWSFPRSSSPSAAAEVDITLVGGLEEGLTMSAPVAESDSHVYDLDLNSTLTVAFFCGREQRRLAGGELIHSTNADALPADDGTDIAAPFFFGMAMLLLLPVTSGRFFT